MYENKIFCGQFNVNEKILYGILEIKNNNISLELHDFESELRLDENTFEAIQGTIVEKIDGYELDFRSSINSQVYLKKLIPFRTSAHQALFHVGECFFARADITEELKFNECFFQIETSHNRIFRLARNESVDCFFSEEERKESGIFTFEKQEFKLEIAPNSIAPNSKKYHCFTVECSKNTIDPEILINVIEIINDCFSFFYGKPVQVLNCFLLKKKEKPLRTNMTYNFIKSQWLIKSDQENKHNIFSEFSIPLDLNDLKKNSEGFNYYGHSEINLEEKTEIIQCFIENYDKITAPLNLYFSLFPMDLTARKAHDTTRLTHLVTCMETIYPHLTNNSSVYPFKSKEDRRELESKILNLIKSTLREVEPKIMKIMESRITNIFSVTGGTKIEKCLEIYFSILSKIIGITDEPTDYNEWIKEITSETSSIRNEFTHSGKLPESSEAYELCNILEFAFKICVLHIVGVPNTTLSKIISSLPNLSYVDDFGRKLIQKFPDFLKS